MQGHIRHDHTFARVLVALPGLLAVDPDDAVADLEVSVGVAALVYAEHDANLICDSEA